MNTVGARGQQTIELNLVLAFDASASVNDVEFNLQRMGTSAAFLDSAVAQAIERAAGGIAVSIVQWSSISRQRVGLGWHRLMDRSSIERFAAAVAKMPRRIPGGGTMIHSGLAFAGGMLSRSPYVARREVIDLSGNGVSDDLHKTHQQRNRLVASGVVINALAIEELKRDLTTYFRENVIGGAYAFVVTASGFEEFRKAMQMKLLREIEGPLISRRSTHPELAAIHELE